jgi:hypothetical protein
MLFDLDDVQKEPNLDLLRCVDISTAPSGWVTNESHFITFRSETDSSPLWCSQPVEGKALGFKEWVSPDSKIGPKKLTAKETVKLIETTYDEVRSATGKREPPLFKPRIKTSILPESLTILEFTERRSSLNVSAGIMEPGRHKVRLSNND